MDENDLDLASIEGRLAYARYTAGYASAAAAADAFGWQYSTYAGHENGSRGIKLPMLRGYAAAFHVSFEWLANGKGEARPKGEHLVTEAYRTMAPDDRALFESFGQQLADRAKAARKKQAG